MNGWLEPRLCAVSAPGDTEAAVSQQDAEIVRGIYEAWHRSGGVMPLELVDPEIEVEIVGGPVGGTYRGHSGLNQMLESWWSAFAEPRIDVEEIVDSGDGVLAKVHYFARGRASGVEVDLRGWQVWRLRRGKVVRWSVANTKAEALEAAGRHHEQDEAPNQSA
jgi:ketosteroid isomerase-like protein